jgi:DNA-binding transcriptional LysR family regulator
MKGPNSAIRIGHLEDSTLRARRIGSYDRVFVASEDYLEKRGVPQTPEDLRNHDCVIYTLLSSGAIWRFRDIEIPVSGKFRVNSPDAVSTAVTAGLGVGHGPAWLFDEGIKSGRLKFILTGYSVRPSQSRSFALQTDFANTSDGVHGLHCGRVFTHPSFNQAISLSKP